MSRLDELIAELCPDGVEYVPLGDVLKNNNSSNSIPKKDYKEVGKIPIIDQSQAYIAGYTDDESAVPPILPCIIFGDHTRVVKYADMKFAQGDSGTKVFIPATDAVITKYIYYAFCNLEIPSRGYNRHWTIVKDIKIPLPPLPVQQEIVRILDKFTELTAEFTAELTAELTARKKQYEYYRDLLLTFDDKPEVKWMTLGDVSQISVGQKPDEKITESGLYPFINAGTTESGFVSSYNTESNTITTPSRGQGGIGYVGFQKTKFWCGPLCYRIRSNTSIVNTKFLYYFMSSVRNKLLEFKQTGSVPALNRKELTMLKVPVPAIEEQERIVAILDRFDTLCNNLTSGLPAEIEARKKQYEYYRDKLLTFKEKSA